ncbi:MAG TPA: response regulator [Stellaceae bacterium]|nr:response regulator [Stellaceae bacterium]
MADALTVLFVEDESDLRDLVMGMLLAKGFRVFVAADGVDALHILRQHHVDLLFTDIVMPGMNGVLLARYAKDVQPQLKVLFTTGYVQRALERNAVLYGPVLFKPLRHTEIIQEVEALLGSAT